MPRRPFLLFLACASALLAMLLGTGSTAPSWSAPKPTAPARSVSVRVLPQLAATGTAPEPAAVALTSVTATFTPASAGRAVSLEVRDGKRWVPSASGAQDASGRVVFNAAYAWRGTPATYRVVAPKVGSAAQVVSASLRTDAWSIPIFSDEFSGSALAAPWDHRIQGYEVPSRRCSRTDASATRVAGGVLELGVIDDPSRDDLCTFVNGQGVEQSTFYRLNGHVGTQGRFAYTYGVAAARSPWRSRPSRLARGECGALSPMTGRTVRLTAHTPQC